MQKMELNVDEEGAAAGLDKEIRNNGFLLDSDFDNKMRRGDAEGAVFAENNKRSEKGVGELNDRVVAGEDVNKGRSSTAAMFTRSNGKGLVTDEPSLRKANISGSHIGKASFRKTEHNGQGMDLSQISKVEIKGQIMNKSNISKTNSNGQIVERKNFSSANSQGGTDFSMANSNGQTNFSSANSQGRVTSDFSKANSNGQTNFSSANSQGRVTSDFSKANINGEGTDKVSFNNTFNFSNSDGYIKSDRNGTEMVRANRNRTNHNGSGVPTDNFSKTIGINGTTDDTHCKGCSVPIGLSFYRERAS